MSVEHASWCWSLYTPRAHVGGHFKTGPRAGSPKTVKREGRCNCGAATSPVKRLLRRLREMVE